MSKSAKFNKVKGYFDNGLWTAAMVRNAIGRWITAEEADEIIGAADAESGGSGE